jgi:hypothetical protein
MVEHTTSMGRSFIASLMNSRCAAECGSPLFWSAAISASVVATASRFVR